VWFQDSYSSLTVPISIIQSLIWKFINIFDTMRLCDTILHDCWLPDFCGNDNMALCQICDKRFFSGRYHIAGTKGVFYAREPYVNDSSLHVTRFIGLANVGNKEKQVY
jgi:hypothetical protein